MYLSDRTTLALALSLALATIAWGAWLALSNDPFISVSAILAARPLTFGDLVVGSSIPNADAWIFLMAAILPLGLVMVVIADAGLSRRVWLALVGTYALLALIAIVWGAGAIDGGWVSRFVARAITPAG